MTYTQKVSFEGDRLIFTNRSGTQGGETVQAQNLGAVVGRN